MRHTDVVRGSTAGCARGLEKKENGIRGLESNCKESSHFEWFQLLLRLRLFHGEHEPDVLFLP